MVNMPDLRLDYNFVLAKKAPGVVTTNRVIHLATLTNAEIGDRYYQYYDIEGRILLVPERLHKDD